MADDVNVMPTTLLEEVASFFSAGTVVSRLASRDCSERFVREAHEVAHREFHVDARLVRKQDGKVPVCRYGHGDDVVRHVERPMQRGDVDDGADDA